MTLEKDHNSESNRIKDKGILRFTYPILKIQGWIFGPIILYNHIFIQLARQGNTYPEVFRSMGILCGTGILLFLGTIWIVDFIFSYRPGINIFNMFDTGRYYPIIKHSVISLLMIGFCSLIFGIILMIVYGSEYVRRYNW